jgi:hypothetical protein
VSDNPFDDLVELARDALEELIMSGDDMIDRIEELEAKLCTALEALNRIGSGEFSGRMLTSMPPQDAAAYFARTTIAELKGEDRG